MRRVACNISLFLFSVLLIAGCSAGKQLVSTGMAVRPTKSAVALLPSANRNVEYLTANIKMNAAIGGEEAKAKGKLRVKHGEGVQISATAMGLMEAACFEFLPHAVRFIYKIDKIYAEDSYAGVPFFVGTGTGYNILEPLILNSMFSPDGSPFTEALAGMDVAQDGDYITVTTSGVYPVVYRFYIDKRTGNLVKSEGRYANGGNVVCRYSDFIEFNGAPFPRSVELSFSGNGSQATLTFELGNPTAKEFKFSSRRVSKAYERVSLEGIVGSMDNME